jgi:hypothetical protein
MVNATVERLLATTYEYMVAQSALRRAVQQARSEGMTEDRIAEWMGFSRPMLEQIAGRAGGGRS